MRSISSSVTVSGGMRITTSPSGRSSTPRRTAAAQTRRPHRSAVGRGRQLDAAHEPAQADLGHLGAAATSRSDASRASVAARARTPASTSHSS